MKRNKQVLWAMTELGDDLIDAAQRYRPKKTIWRHLLPMAACLVAVLGLWQIGRQLQPVSEKPAPSSQEEVRQKQFLPLEQEAIWMPEREDYYAFRLGGEYAAESDTVIVNGNGVPMVETQEGVAGLLRDEWSGEIRAILRRQEKQLVVLDFEGTEIARLEAAWMYCFGDLAVTEGEYGEPLSLYHIPTQRLLAENLQNDACMGDYLYVVPKDYENGRFLIYDHSGALRLRGTGTQEINNSMVVDGTLYLGINAVKTGDVSIIDQNGNAVTDRTYPYDAYWYNGYIWWSENGEQRVLDLRTGQEVFSVPEQGEHGETIRIGLVYENLALLFINDLTGGVRLVDFSGTPIIPDIASKSVQVEFIDDEGDGIPELLACGNDGGGFYEMSYYTPDGTLVRKVPVTGSVDAVSSRTVLHTEQGKGITLIHLESGETLTEFEKPYTDAVPLWPLEGGVQFSTGLFYAIYTDETGRQRVDLLREDGTVMLENLADFDSDIARQGAGPYEGGGAFRVEGGFRHIDGTWLYREQSPKPETLPADSVYVLELSGGGCVAVDQTGAELLRADRGGLYPLTDKTTGEILAICHTVHPEEPENGKCTTTIYDLSGNLLQELEAWGIQVFGDVAIVQWDSAEFALYSRSTESVLQSDLEKADVLGSTVVVRPRGEAYDTAFWSKDGSLIATIGGGEQETGFFVETWTGTAYYDVYNVYLQEDGTRTTGNHGVIDDHGNWIVEPQYQDLELLANGYAACFDGAFQNVVDLDTGKVVAQIPAEAGAVRAAYENLVLVSLDESPRTAQQALSWDGTPITDVVNHIEVIDDEGDGTAELLQFYRGNNTVWLLPDGTLLREAACQGLTVTSKTAVLLEKGRLLELQTGREIPLPDRNYTAAMALWSSKGDEDYATGLFFASYTDENGQTRTDILREDGTLLLENYACERSKWGWDYERSGVFRVEGGFRHIDGTWLYRE